MQQQQQPAEQAVPVVPSSRSMDQHHQQQPPLSSSIRHDHDNNNKNNNHSILLAVSWWQQLVAVLRKNCLQLSRRPLQLLVMTCSSAGFVLLATLFVNGKEKDVDFGNVTLTECGTVDPTYLATLDYDQQRQVPISYNEPWRNGFAVALMAFGPMMHAVICFVMIQTEIQTQMLGILRAAGLADSVFWASWWIPMTLTSLVNALVAAITASAVEIHALQHIYFGGVLGSFFFTNLGLVGASFFIAAVCGTTRGGAATWCVILILLAPWGPYLRQLTQSGALWSSTPSDVEGLDTTPNGLFWTNLETTQTTAVFVGGNGDDEEDVFTMTQCERPLLSEQRGDMFVTSGQQQQSGTVPPLADDEMFVGCYFGAGYVNAAWNQYTHDMHLGQAILFMFPYWHFASVWGNFLGYTAMPDRQFTAAQAALTPEELAMESLPAANTSDNEDRSGGLTLFPQYSTLNIHYPYYNWGTSESFVHKTNCPPADQKDYFCPDLDTRTCLAATDRAPTQSPSVHALFGYLFALSLLYTAVAAYWTNIFPGKNGAPRRFYFFLLPRYWLGSRMADPSSGEEEDGVEIDNVRKQYGGNEAVKGVTMKLQSGEVTALLGHNGAGKTSLSHILSCEIAPTSGDVSVFGYSVKEETDKVRRLVAVCKQDDYLYPDLSAYEHLALFAGIRGVARQDIPQVVEKWLDSVDLSIVQDHYSSSFSGGMKRRLSLACCTIGERPVLILDECTTGMDPISRRFVWKHIDAIKEGKVVLLTTHAMEEADLLADSVAVMRKGTLAAYGTPLELKSQYGSALQFTLLVDSQQAPSAAKAIQHHFAAFPSFTAIEAGEAGNMTVKISSIATEEKDGVPVQVLTEFVKWLDNKAVSGVTEYGFSNSSLEEVFLAVTRAEDEEQPVQDELDEFAVCCTGCSRGCTLCCLRSCCRCCCCPRRRVQMQDHDDAAVNGQQALGSDASGIASFRPVLSSWRQTEAVLRFSFARNWLGSGAKASWIFHVFFVGMAFMLAVRGTNTQVVVPFMVAPTLFLSLGLVSFVSPIYRDRNNGVFYLMRTQGLLRTGYIGGMGLYAFLVQLAFGLVLLTFVYVTGFFGEPEVCSVEDQSDDFYDSCEGNRWSFTRVAKPVKMELLSQGDGVELYAVWQSGGYLKVIGAALAFALTTPGAVFSSAYLPGFKFAIVIVAMTVFMAGMAPLISYFLLGLEDRLKCATDICDIFETESFSSLTGESLLNCVGLELHYSALGSLCMPARAAILPQFGLFQMLSMTVISKIAFVSNPPEYATEVLIPLLGNDVKCDGNVCQFPYAHSLYGANLGFTLLGALLLLILGVSLVSFFSFPDGLSLRVRNYLSNLYKGIRSLGSRSRPSMQASKSNADDEPFEEVVQESEVVESIVQNMQQNAPEGDEFGDEELARQGLPPVLAHKLHKVYPALGGRPPKVALKSLDLHVPKGQVLGLLGQNGAGKTTAIKILAASHEATSGLALVAGYDVSTESKGVFEHLGNCPQFDVVWPGQSIQRHLEFFAMLKGLPRTQVRTIAYSVAKAVGLGASGVYERQAGHLSGGMRRRLSIAISLIGAPSVMTLDEPTTGLDPSTRNSIWNLVNSFATPERAIIITTHMMLEADTLCNRIAIMSRGRLKVVATQQALKDRFGSGYLLQLNLTKSTLENQAKALTFVKRRIHEDAVLQSKQAKTLRIALPRDISLTDVFGVLYSNEALEEGCINQFLLSQSSLEDVFIALGDS